MRSFQITHKPLGPILHKTHAFRYPKISINPPPPKPATSLRPPQSEVKEPFGTKSSIADVRGLVNRSALTSKKSSIVERNIQWQTEVKEKILRVQNMRMQDEMHECTFSPKRITKQSKLANGYEEAVKEKTEALINLVNWS